MTIKQINKKKRLLKETEIGKLFFYENESGVNEYAVETTDGIKICGFESKHKAYMELYFNCENPPELRYYHWDHPQVVYPWIKLSNGESVRLGEWDKSLLPDDAIMDSYYA